MPALSILVLMASIGNDLETVHLDSPRPSDRSTLRVQAVLGQCGTLDVVLTPVLPDTELSLDHRKRNPCTLSSPALVFCSIVYDICLPCPWRGREWLSFHNRSLHSSVSPSLSSNTILCRYRSRHTGFQNTSPRHRYLLIKLMFTATNLLKAQDIHQRAVTPQSFKKQEAALPPL